jgi:hypothetical protein
MLIKKKDQDYDNNILTFYYIYIYKLERLIDIKKKKVKIILFFSIIAINLVEFGKW